MNIGHQPTNFRTHTESFCPPKPKLLERAVSTFASRIAFEYNRPVALDPDERYIACVGSVGYGRDLVGKLRYAIHDRDASTLELRSVDGPLLPIDEALRAAGGA